VERIGTERVVTPQLKTIVEPNLVVLREEEPESEPSKDSRPAVVQPFAVHAAQAPKTQFVPEVRTVRQVQPNSEPEQVIRISIGPLKYARIPSQRHLRFPQRHPCGPIAGRLPETL